MHRHLHTAAMPPPFPAQPWPATPYILCAIACTLQLGTHTRRAEVGRGWGGVTRGRRAVLHPLSTSSPQAAAKTGAAAVASASRAHCRTPQGPLCDTRAVVLARCGRRTSSAPVGQMLRKGQHGPPWRPYAARGCGVRGEHVRNNPESIVGAGRHLGHARVTRAAARLIL